jgi:hypothetical protein
MLSTASIRGLFVGRDAVVDGVDGEDGGVDLGDMKKSRYRKLI